MLNDADYVTQFYKWDRSGYTLPFEVVPGEAGVTIQADMKAHVKQRKKVAAGVSKNKTSLTDSGMLTAKTVLSQCRPTE